MSLKRVLTSLIALPFVILTLLLGNNYIISAIIFILGIICMHEYFNAIKKVSKPIEWIGYISNIFIILATFIKNEIFYKIMIILLPFIILLLFLQVIFTEMKYTFKDVAYTLIGIYYIPFFLMFLPLLRNIPDGKFYVFYVFSISWSTDVMAYLIGRNFGKHKFSKISPKKTVEGCLFGIVGAIFMSIVFTIIFRKFWHIEMIYSKIITISIILSIVSQIGDFVASIIKRFTDIKDYGNLLPGHGGMLDRIDSVIFIIPFAYLIFLYI